MTIKLPVPLGTYNALLNTPECPTYPSMFYAIWLFNLNSEDALGINSVELTRVGKRLAKAIKLMTGYEIEVGGSRYVSIPLY